MKIASEVSARIANASLVAAFAVVVLHVAVCALPAGATPSAALMSFLRDFTRFAVPFFFTVSGYLLAGHTDEPGWWRREVMKRFVTLGLPYVVWSVLFGLYLLLGAAGSGLSHGQAFDFADWWQEKRLILFGLDLRREPLLLPLWYLRTLFLLVFASGILTALLRRWGLLVLASGGILYLGYAVSVEWAPQIVTHDFGALARQTFSPEAFFFFMLGLWLRLKDIAPRACASGPLLLAATSLFALRQFIGAWLPYPLVIPLAAYGVWCAVPSTPWPKRLTSLAFPVYLVHWFLIHLLVRVWPTGDAGTVFWVVIAVLVAGVSGGLGFLLHRFLPRAAGVLFGGR